MNKISFILILSLIATVVHSQDRIFTYTYQSSVLNTDQREIEVWNTMKTGREKFYRALNSRLEFEFGVAKNLQTAMYLNVGSSAEEIHTINSSGLAEVTIQSEMEWGFSNEWKYKFSDPVANSIGSAFYLELELAPKVFALESKIILDKNIGITTHALNIGTELEWKSEVTTNDSKDTAFPDKVESEFELKVELDYGLSFKLNNHWNLGLEMHNENIIEEEKWISSVLYAGPGFSFSNKLIWINLSVLPQITGLKYPNDQQSGLLLKDNEKLQTRLIFSYAF